MRIRGPLTQRSEFTSKRNVDAGRHGWLRLTPAYSLHLVTRIISQYGLEDRLLDPFGGTGTTALCGAMAGFNSVSVDVNPFLVWLARAKTAAYSASALEDSLRAAAKVARRAMNPRARSAKPPSIHNIDRWWGLEELQYLCRLKAALTDTPMRTDSRDLLTVAFCRVIIQTANVTRGHQSLSFRMRDDPRAAPVQLDLGFREDPFTSAFTVVRASARENPLARVKVINDDARRLTRLTARSIDLVVTSPPYPNRVTTIRELRPYMYWLDYLREPADAGELDWSAIGGTWGSATSRLSSWIPSEGSIVPPVVVSAADRIQAKGGRSAFLMAQYVRRYFVDMHCHFGELKRVLRPGARLHYVVGNSSFYGEIIESEKAFVSMLRRLGFSKVQVSALRKRNSKSELFEFLVSAVHD